MSRKYKVLDKTGLHFLTATIVGWIDLFSRQVYRDILLDSLRWCQENRGLHICAYVVMTNHIHLVAHTEDEKYPLDGVMQNFKKFTAGKILEAVQTEGDESRREWLLHLFQFYGKKVGQPHQIWQHGNHPILLWSPKVIQEKIDYIHMNPVKAGLVTRPQHWLYSSAADYFENQAGLLEVDILEFWSTLK